MNKKGKLLIAKHAVYVALIVVLYVCQTTPGVLVLLGIKPNMVIAAAVCIAMYEGEFVGGVYGALAGVFCDLGGFTLFGFNAIILLAVCVAVGLAFIYLLRCSVLNFTLILFGVLLTRGLLDFLINYAMWGYADVSMVLVRQILPGVVYTTAVGPLVYYLYGWMYRKFDVSIQD